MDKIGRYYGVGDNKKRDAKLLHLFDLVAEAGLEPTTFGL